MKQFIVIVIFLITSGDIHAERIDYDLERILFQTYDSIRIEMIRTACEITGVKDSAFLKEISEGRVDSAIAHYHVDPILAQLLQDSDMVIVGKDYIEFDTTARIIRAKIMGHLMIQNYKNERTVLERFDLYKRVLDSLRLETGDYTKALKDSTLDDFRRKYPNSKFCTLIKSKHEKNDVDNHIYFLYVAIGVAVLLGLLLALLFFGYKRREKMKSCIGEEVQPNRQPKEQNGHSDDSEETSIQGGTMGNSIRDTSDSLDIKTHNAWIKNDVSEVVDATFSFAESHDCWMVVGTSVIGNSHILSGLPCQDNNRYVYIKNGWGIAITSDGAGSAKHSDIGSRIIVERGAHYFQSIIEQKQWIEKNVLPTEAEWTSMAYVALKAIRKDLEKFAVTKKLELGSLSATIIVVIHTPSGFLVTHVGDGRAGYKDETGEWKALLTPHKGDEANQTIFLTNNFWDYPYYVMSGVMVPESHVVRCHPVAFTLMSDGCEDAAWQCNMKNETTGVFCDPNKPFDRFFNPLVANLSRDDISDLKTRWVRFIEKGNESFKSESDDKTMILGVLK